MKAKGAKILIDCLINEGVNTVFGYPGGSVLDIFDELYKASDKIKQILTSHEQGAAHAADGYARATGRVGVVLATSGPGATNLVTGIANAYMDSVPLVAITGNVAVANLGRDSFQEVDITGITMPITKHNYIVKDVAELAEIISEAFLIAKSGRPGPVLIDIPKNIQQQETEYSPLPVRKPEPKKPCDKAVKAAADIINAATRPLIYYGGGIISSNAEKALVALAQKIDAPVASSLMGLGGFPASHPNYLGLIGMHGLAACAQATRECDVLVVVGARFSDRVAGDRNAFASQAKIIHIDADDAEINKNVRSRISIVADANLALTALVEAVKPAAHTEWRNYLAGLKENAGGQKESLSLPLNPRDILREINRQKPDIIVATDVGQHQMWTAQTFRFEKPRRLITSGGLGAMGFGLGAAIGASYGTKKHAVLITGDGSFHMNFNEVVTAVKLCLPIAIFVFNNNTLGMVRQWQKMFYQKRFSSTTLDRPTDYKYLAKALGAKYLELTDGADTAQTVRKALASSLPVIVNCIIGTDENVLPMIPAGQAADRIITTLDE